MEGINKLQGQYTNKWVCKVKQKGGPECEIYLEQFNIDNRGNITGNGCFPFFFGDFTIKGNLLRSGVVIFTMSFNGSIQFKYKGKMDNRGWIYGRYSMGGLG